MAAISLFDQRRREGQMDIPSIGVSIDAGKPMRARRVQLPCDIGLFSDDADQLDLVSWFTEQTED
jgi:hypothetical protein